MPKRVWSRGALGCALAGLMAVAVACGSSDGAGSEAADGGEGPVKIGYVASLTGAAAADAARDVAGARIAVDEINAAGGVLGGRRLELVVRDDRSDPTAATRLARDLVLSEGVAFLGGGETSSGPAAVAQVAEVSKVPYVISTAASDSLTEQDGNPYTFRSWSNSRIMPGPVASYAARQPWRRYVIVFGNFEFGRTLASHFVTNLQRDNPDVQIVERIPANLEDTDFSGVINRAKAARPDAVFVAGLYGRGYLAFAKQAVPAGLYDDAHVMSFMGGADLEELGPVLPSGKQIGFNAFYPEIDDPFAREFADKVQRATGEIADGSNFIGWVTIQWMARALERAESTDGTRLAEALDGATLDTYVGEVTMREVDNQATGSYWYGTVVERDGRPTMTDLGNAPGEDYLLAPDEVEALRR